jgi:hypothetical protein
MERKILFTIAIETIFRNVSIFAEVSLSKTTFTNGFSGALKINFIS